MKKRVKVIKCSNEGYWYKDSIGDVFDIVTNENVDFLYDVIDRDACLIKYDCKVVDIIKPIKYIKTHEI
jgi:hypothetical protein